MRVAISPLGVDVLVLMGFRQRERERVIGFFPRIQVVKVGRVELGDHSSIGHDSLEGSQETRFPYLLTTRTRFIGFGGFDMIDQKRFSVQ